MKQSHSPCPPTNKHYDFKRMPGHSHNEGVIDLAIPLWIICRQQKQQVSKVAAFPHMPLSWLAAGRNRRFRKLPRFQAASEKNVYETIGPMVAPKMVSLLKQVRSQIRVSWLSRCVSGLWCYICRPTNAFYSNTNTVQNTNNNNTNNNNNDNNNSSKKHMF
jgi:hypothetical protein